MGDFYQNGIVTTLHNLVRHRGRHRGRPDALSQRAADVAGSAIPVPELEARRCRLLCRGCGAYLDEVVIGRIAPMRTSTDMLEYLGPAATVPGVVERWPEAAGAGPETAGAKSGADEMGRAGMCGTASAMCWRPA